MRHQPINNGLSPQLLQQIQQHLEQNGQILLFLNRRGYAPTLLCHNCGWAAACENCDARLTLHQQPKYLHCHHCNTTKPVYKICPKCNSDQIVAIGLGTERVEETLQEIFPATPLVRIDRDSTSRKGSMEQMLNAINNNQCQILIGTQMLAKGHHFPNITMVAILNIDGGLLSSDFRASEQISQLIMQVAGRAGRAAKAGKVYIQTYNPNHPLLQCLIKQGYEAFAASNLTQRQAASMPPFSHFALIRAEAKNKTAAMEFLTQLKENQPTNINLLGPIPAPMQRKAGLYRAQLLINSKNRTHLHQALDFLTQKIDNLKTSHLKWSLDVDPLDMG
jgi:primosomal protein N' (replication factor Y)